MVSFWMLAISTLFCGKKFIEGSCPSYFGTPSNKFNGTQCQFSYQGGQCASCCPSNYPFCCDDGTCMSSDPYCRYPTSCCAEKFCGSRCCSPDYGTPCGNVCAPKKLAVCCDSSTGVTCPAGQTCCGTSGCCAAGQICNNGHCCPVSTTYCGPGQCCSSSQTCSNGHCCASGATWCSGASKCCSSTQTCQSNQCCPNSQVCGGTCCPTGQSCYNGVCSSCPSDRSCGTVCCPAGQTCVGGTCCTSANSCAGKSCCNSGETCCNGVCCDFKSYECCNGNGNCCKKRFLIGASCDLCGTNCNHKYCDCLQCTGGPETVKNIVPQQDLNEDNFDGSVKFIKTDFAVPEALPPPPTKVMSPSSYACFAQPNTLMTAPCKAFPCLESMSACGNNGYLSMLNTVYCTNAAQYRAQFTADGQKFLTCVQNCISKQHVQAFQSGVIPCCDSLATWGSAAVQKNCYVGCSFCSVYNLNTYAFTQLFQQSDLVAFSMYESYCSS